ncbi:MAG: hypothetical protein AMXMBFR33_61770 [Candidatus Xenobia bacterium]
MNVTATLPMPACTQHGPRKAAEPEKEPTSSLPGPLGWLDRYTQPRSSTDGDLEENSYIQPMFHSIPAGFAFMGLEGVIVASGASLASTFVSRKTGSRALALAAGAAFGAAAAAGLGSLTGPVGVAQVVGGCLLGGLHSFRGDKAASVRDASGNATLINGLFLPGTSKLAGAIGSGVGACLEDEPTWKKVAVGAATGAALGGALVALGQAPAGMALTVSLSALAGGVGPMFGPRFSQGFRNLGQDSGRVANQGLRRLGVPEEKLNDELANNIGAFPGQFLKEGLRGFINSDMNVSALFVGGLVESAELIALYAEQKRHPEKKGHGHSH